MGSKSGGDSVVVGGNPVTRDPVTQWILDLVVLVFGGSMDLVSGEPSAMMVVDLVTVTLALAPGVWWLVANGGLAPVSLVVVRLWLRWSAKVQMVRWQACDLVVW